MDEKIKEYNILIIDDKEDVLSEMKEQIGAEHFILKQKYRFKIDTICVKVEENKSGERIISKFTIEELIKKMKKKYDLLLLDYGYLKPNETNNLLEECKNADTKEKEYNIRKKILTPHDLINNSYKKEIRNLKNHLGRIILYTYIPPEIQKCVFDDVSRENNIKNLFIKSKIEFLDTSRRLFGNGRFAENYSRQYYPFIVSKYLEQMICKFIVEDINTEKLKIKGTSKIISSMALIVGMIGALSAYISNFLVGLFDKYPIITIILLITFLLVIVVGSFGIQKYFEKKISDLFNGDNLS